MEARDAANQVLYAVMSNPHMLEWLRNHVAANQAIEQRYARQ